MAQETKVGLVVGLGFIVCFATILANRGAADRIRPQMPYQLFSNPSPPSLSPTGILPETHAQHIGRSDRPVPVVGQRAPEAVATPDRSDMTSHHRDGAGPKTGIVADPEQFTRRRPPIPEPLDLSEPVVAGAADEGGGMPGLPDDGIPPAEAGPEPVPSPAAGPRVRTATAHAELPESLAPFADRFERVPQRQNPVAAAEVGHVVEKGDTLTAIAHRYYGSSSTRIVSAVFEANRSVMNCPDVVVVGSTLCLPVAESILPQDHTPGARRRDASAQPTEPADRPEPSYRWYTVKEGDLLGTIAQRELGSSKRWKEILALNEDVCSDARRLPYGVRIRIPINILADAR